MTKGMQLALSAEVELRADFAKVDPADQPHVLARHIYELTRRALEGRPDPDGRIQLLTPGQPGPAAGASHQTLSGVASVACI